MTATTRDRRYSLTTPCRNCPFRTDVEPYLRPERAREIADSIRGGGEFACHKTTIKVDDGLDEVLDDPGSSKVCAGALGVMKREGAFNQMARISERLGMFDPDRLDEDAPVYDSLSDWVRAYQDDIPTVTDSDGNVIEFEHCGVVEDDCEDPAGYGGAFGTAANDDTPTCNPLEDVCEGCSRTACKACRSDQWDERGQWCVMCISPDDDDEDTEETR